MIYALFSPMLLRLLLLLLLLCATNGVARVRGVDYRRARQGVWASNQCNECNQKLFMVATDVDVNSYGRPHTASSKAKISAANKGKVPWNVGRKHSEETKLRIAAKTREAIIKKKTEQANKLGLTLTEFEESKEKKKMEKKQSKLKGGLTVEGRQRISASLKARWNDPEYRKLYTINARGNRNHSESTRAKISEAIKVKWQDEKYRSKISISPSPEVRARISATLKAKWELPEFREKMMSSLSSRSDEWKMMISEKIMEKWNDPAYRQAVEEGHSLTHSLTHLLTHSITHSLTQVFVIRIEHILFMLHP